MARIRLAKGSGATPARSGVTTSCVKPVEAHMILKNNRNPKLCLSV